MLRAFSCFVLVFSFVQCPSVHAQSPSSGYTVTFVKSDRKWGIGAFHEPYNKISEYFEQQLTDALEKKGGHQTLAVQSGCCRVALELLEVSNRVATFHKVGVDVSASVTITDADGKLIYGKGYRGESRALAKGWKHLVRLAVDDLTSNLLQDENFTRVLATGKI